MLLLSCNLCTQATHRFNHTQEEGERERESEKIYEILLCIIHSMYTFCSLFHFYQQHVVIDDGIGGGDEM